MREHGLQQFPGPGEKGPFEFTFGAPIFEYLAKNPEAKKNFDCVMTGRRDGGPIRWFETYPVVSQLLNRPENDSGNEMIVVDVAGNVGHDLLDFATAYPSLSGRLVLEDLPLTFANMEDNDKFKLVKAGINLQEYDFFSPQPIKGARAYFFRDICHDWPDTHARQFLRQTAEAMRPKYSRLLIEDHVVDDRDAHHRPATSDILMMLLLTGIERTRRQWTDLLASVGLVIVKIWPSRRGLQSVIEAMKKV